MRPSSVLGLDDCRLPPLLPHPARHPLKSPPLSIPSPHFLGLEVDSKFQESLEGLRVIQLVRPTVFNFVLPKLLKTPMTVNNIR